MPESVDRPSEAALATWKVFAFQWGLAVLLAQVSHGTARTPTDLAVTLLSLAVLLFPGRLLPLVLLCGVCALPLRIWEHGGHVVLHRVMIELGCVAVLGAVALTWHRDERRWAAAASAAVARVGPVLVSISILGAGLSKFNDGYLDPRTSCAVYMEAWERLRFPASLLPHAPWVDELAIFGPITAELLGSTFTLHPRTRRLGFVGFASLMLLIGLNLSGPFYEFTVPFLALASLWFDGRPVLALVRRVPARVRLGVAVAAVLAVVALAVGETLGIQPELRHSCARVVFSAVYGGFTLAVAVLPVGSSVTSPVPARARLLWVLPPLFLLHEGLPYLGLRTERNFVMGSNFVLDARESDDLLVRHPPDLGFNRIARVVAVDPPTHELEPGSLVVLVLLDDFIARHPHRAFVFDVGGERVVVNTPERHATYVANPLVPLLRFDHPHPYPGAAPECGMHLPPGTEPR